MKPSVEISVIICTHNPRSDYLRRVLDALKMQTLPKEQWELLLVDNASQEPLAGQCDLSWHLHARHIFEPELGLTPARLKGIKESIGDTIVFVDDDNVLASDYLTQTSKIAAEFKHLGAWGGGIVGEFEGDLPEWLKPYLECLAVRPLKTDCWTNMYGWSDALPVGAGICVRRNVAEYYSKNCDLASVRRKLDRRGGSLGCGGDVDLAYCAPDIGLGFGRFRVLQINHLITRQRMQLSYLLKLMRGAYASAIIVGSLRAQTQRKLAPVLPVWRDFFFLRRLLKANRLNRQVLMAQRQGEADAWNLLLK